MNATLNDCRKLTQAELVAEARERFGDDPMNWAFQCPCCGDIATGLDFRNALAENPSKRKNGEPVIASDLLGQECIGRTLGALDKHRTYTGRGCDWAAYGLFRGPWEIVLPSGRSAYGFPLAARMADPAERFAAYRAGQLAEQRHQYLDPAEPPHAFHTPEVTA